MPFQKQQYMNYKHHDKSNVLAYKHEFYGAWTWLGRLHYCAFDLHSCTAIMKYRVVQSMLSCFENDYGKLLPNGSEGQIREGKVGSAKRQGKRDFSTIRKRCIMPLQPRPQVNKVR